MVAVTPATRSPFSASGTESGSSAHGLAQLSWRTSIGTSVTSGPGTCADARATAAACSPARRASASVGSGTATNPHDDPTRARTPTPTDSRCTRSSTSPLRADIDSLRWCMARASAYRAPAASAASTAASATSNMVSNPNGLDRGGVTGPSR